ncbi:hypothetical protein Tco_0096621 [Tanacetum coccineum]
MFALPIQLDGRFDTHDLADTGSNINIIPYRIFEELGIEHVKPISHNMRMLNHSEAEPMGFDRTVLIIVGRSFLHTCGGIINTLNGTTSTFDGVCHQNFYVVEIQNNGEESDSDDEEEYYLKRDEIGGDEILFTFEAWRRAFDINEPIYTKLCQEFYSTYEFDEVVPDDELMTKKLIKFRLCGRAHYLSVLDFARRLGLYTSIEIQDDGFETYFLEGLRNDENFNSMDYWLIISSEEELHLIAKRLDILTDEVLDGLSAPTYCRASDVITLKELTDPNGRLISEDPAPGILRVATPKGPCPTITELYDKISRIETRQVMLERMACRQLYQLGRYVRVLEYMAGQYNVILQREYAPPGYDEEQHDDEE